MHSQVIEGSACCSWRTVCGLVFCGGYCCRSIYHYHATHISWCTVDVCMFHHRYTNVKQRCTSHFRRILHKLLHPHQRARENVPQSLHTVHESLSPVDLGCSEAQSMPKSGVSSLTMRSSGDNGPGEIDGFSYVQTFWEHECLDWILSGQSTSGSTR